MKNAFNLLLLGLLVVPTLNCKDIPDPEVNPQAFEIYKQEYITNQNFKKMMNHYFPGIYKKIQIDEKATLNWVKNNKNNSDSNEIDKESLRTQIIKNRELCRAMSNGYQSIIHLKLKDFLRMQALAWQANQCNKLLTKMNRPPLRRSTHNNSLKNYIPKE